jgi:type IV pilus assembly protein PilE
MSAVRANEQSGFTLIELMIVVAVVAVLSALAYPSYSEYVERGRRKDATAVAMEAQQFAERFFTENRTYVGAGAAMPTSFSKSPREGSKVWYNISFTGEAANGYTVSIVPNSWSPRACGTMTINQLGIRSVSYPASASADDVNNCFNK